jgi:hypothetical protein
MTSGNSRPWPGSTGLLTVLALGAALLGPAPARARAPRGDDLDRRLEAQRAALQKFAEAVLARLDAAEQGGNALAARKATNIRLTEAIPIAEKAAEVARGALKEYEEGFLPGELASVRGDIVLAEADMKRAKDRLEWAEDMVKKGFMTRGQQVGEIQEEMKARIALMKIKDQRRWLERFSATRQIPQLKHDVEQAEADLREKRDALTTGRLEQAGLERRARLDAPSADEGRAVVLLDEALTFHEQRQVDAAQAKLDEAETLWRREEARRADIRFHEARRRIGQAAHGLKRPGVPD